MYIEPFQLKELPFRLSPDPQFLYLSKQHARAKAYMESTIWFADGFVVITGEIGSGKTTLIESFLREIPQDVVVAQVNQTQVSAVDFLQSLLAQFGFSPFKMKKGELLGTLNNFLIEQYAAGRRVLLVVDEAQNLSQRVLEEVRLLSGVETTKEKVLRIILAGQPELNDKLDAPELVQLNQRVRLRFHLSALSRAETADYIRHRLEVAGSGDRQIFEDDTFDEIFRYTGGVPRLINTLCDTSMIAAYSADRDRVTAVDVANAVSELQWMEFSARPRRHTGSGSTARSSSSRGNDAPPLARLRIVEGGRTLQEIPLVPGRLILGRTPDNEVQIDSRFISRHHCQITTTRHSTVIEDLNSTNGLYVGGSRVHRHHMHNGDVVLLGKHELVYVDERLNRSRNPNDTLPGIPALEHEADTLAGDELPTDLPFGPSRNAS